MTGSYSDMTFGLKVRKVLRYLRIHGPARTCAKVRGRYHLRAEFETLPEMGPRVASGKHVGLIGCGNFAFSNIAFYLRKNHGRCIRGAMDKNVQRAASLFRRYGLDYYTVDHREILDDPEVDLVYVASNHASHAEYAIEAIEAGKCVHIEKPHVTSHDQLARLRATAEGRAARIHLGFNRPLSPIGKAISKHLMAEEGPSMLNWFVVGHPLAKDHWYHDEREGGRILGNLCHWTDFVYRLIPDDVRYPIRITPTRATKVDCDVTVTYVFGDESIATIAFSAKGKSFSGVRERFSAQRGDVLISMDDFRSLTVENVQRRIRQRPMFLDQGHEASIEASYSMSARGGGRLGQGLAYVCETAELFLATREALETRQEITLDRPLPALVA